MTSPQTESPTIVYTATATSTGGRQGRATSSDGLLDLELRAPKEQGGPGGGTNPEQLFAAGWSACFTSALTMLARRAKIDVSEATVTAHVGLEKSDSGFGLVAELEVRIPGVELSVVQDLADQTHEVCPYSKATRGNVPTTITAVAA